VICGKGNNGGDGLVVARQIFTRFHPRALHVVLTCDPAEPHWGSRRRTFACLPPAAARTHVEITPEARMAGIVIDALLGTGIAGPARGASLEYIRRSNTEFPLRWLSPSISPGLPSDSAAAAGEFVRS